jgi:hypothetical protein
MPVRPRHLSLCALAALLCVAVILPGAASAQTASSNGGAAYVPPPPPAKRAKIANGIAVPPIGAPAPVKRAIAAANQIITKPYVYGGGHKPFSQIAKRLDRGYDCSGAVSHALYGGGLLRSPLDSGSFMSWGERGPGQWITVYTNPGHAYIVIAGLRFDTSRGDRSAPEELRSGTGPRWRKYSRSPAGFRARHPAGL